MKRIVLFATLVTISFAASAEEYLYILSAQAKMLSSPSYNSSTVESLTKGEKVVTLEKNNRWFKVKYNNKEGWLSRLSVSPHPPVKRASRLADAQDSIADESRRRASSVSTTAAVRGLQGDTRARLSDANRADFDSLAKIDAMNVNDSEALAFLNDIN